MKKDEYRCPNCKWSRFKMIENEKQVLILCPRCTNLILGLDKKANTQSSVGGSVNQNSKLSVDPIK
jgi:ssDNA-binding Zn-finger/Zn-ribbon topoisomerase 1